MSFSFPFAIFQVDEIVSVPTKSEWVQRKSIAAGIAKNKEFTTDFVGSATAFARHHHHGIGSSLDWTAC